MASRMYSSLQKLTPIRGRKPSSILIIRRYNLFTEVNPDKGTETYDNNQYPILSIYSLQKLTPIRGRKLVPPFVIGYYYLITFTEVNPDKGTETCLNCLLNNNFLIQFTEVNPDKGTETHEGSLLHQVV